MICRYHEVMLKTIILQLSHRLTGRKVPVPSCRPHPRTLHDDDWYAADPLAHPDLQCMDQRELGDLPFEPRCIRSGR